MADSVISQGIELEGQAELIRQINEIAATGEVSFEALAAAGERAAQRLTRVANAIDVVARRVAAIRTAATNFGTALSTATTSVGKLETQVVRTARNASLLGLAVTGAIGTIVGLGVAAVKSADDLADNAAAIGINVDQYKLLVAQGASVGLTTQQMTQGILRFSQQAVASAEAADQAFAKFVQNFRGGAAAFGLGIDRTVTSGKKIVDLGQSFQETERLVNEAVTSMIDRIKREGGVPPPTLFAELTAKFREMAAGTREARNEITTLTGVAFPARDAFERLLNKVDPNVTAFQKLGIAIARNSDGTVDLVGSMQNAAIALGKLADVNERNAAAQELFGRSGTKFALALQAANVDLKRFQDLMATKQERNAIDTASASLDVLGFAAGEARTRLAAIFAPSIQAGAAGLLRVIEQNIEGLRAFAQRIANEVMPRIESLFRVLGGGAIEGNAFDDATREWIASIVNFRNAVVSTFRDTLIPIFNSFISFLDRVARGLNAVFGTDLTGKGLAIALVVAKITGALSLLGAAFGAARSAALLFNAALVLIGTTINWPVRLVLLVGGAIIAILKLTGTLDLVIDKAKQLFNLPKSLGLGDAAVEATKQLLGLGDTAAQTEAKVNALTSGGFARNARGDWVKIGTGMSQGLADGADGSAFQDKMKAILGPGFVQNARGDWVKVGADAAAGLEQGAKQAGFSLMDILFSPSELERLKRAPGLDKALRDTFANFPATFSEGIEKDKQAWRDFNALWDNTTIGASLTRINDEIIKAFSTIGETISALATNESIQNAFTNIFDTLSAIGTGAVDAFLNLGATADAVASGIVDAFSNIGATLLALGTGATMAFANIGATIAAIGTGTVAAFANIGDTVVAIATLAQQAWTAFDVWWIAFTERVRNSFAQAWEAVKAAAVAAAQATVQLVATAWNALVSNITAAINSVGSLLQNLAQAVVSGIGSLFTSALASITDFVAGVIAQVQSAIDWLKRLVNEKNAATGGSLTDTGGGAATGGGEFARGGIIRGRGTGTSDSIMALVAGARRLIRVSNGEGILTTRALRHYGSGIVHLINSLSLPRFADGGIIDGLAQAFSPQQRGAPAFAAAGGSRSGAAGTRPVIINLNGNRYRLQGTDDVVERLEQDATILSLSSLGRKPGSVG